MASDLKERKVKRLFGYFIKFTFVDELVGFSYWLLVILGIIYLSRLGSSIVMAALLNGIFITSSVIVYFFVVKKFQSYIKIE